MNIQIRTASDVKGMSVWCSLKSDVLPILEVSNNRTSISEIANTIILYKCYQFHNTLCMREVYIARMYLVTCLSLYIDNHSEHVNSETCS